MTLPKSDPSAYFSRQIILYNFTVVVGTPKSKLLKEMCLCNPWKSKGSRDITTAVFHCLKNTTYLYIKRQLRQYYIPADG